LLQTQFYLWGLLALTFSQPQPDIEFHATPHYCLRQLGVIDQHARRGGRQYRQFAAALERLSAVGYQNDAFYDPVRGEHRRVSFRLLSYSLPLWDESSRAWRIVWDPLLFEFMLVSGGYLRFDLQTYRQLDAASRRMFLLLSKVFRRRAASPAFDLRYLGVQVLGFAATLATRDLKAKVSRCVKRLTELEMVKRGDPEAMFRQKANGAMSVRLDRGPYFSQGKRTHSIAGSVDSPLVEPLRAIGVDEGAIRKVLAEYPVRVIQEWVDITLAAEERFGPQFFKRSPAAFFVDNLRNAAAGTRTPPDWWQELRRAEQRSRPAHRRRGRTSDLAANDDTEENVVLPDRVTEAMRLQFEAAGQSTQSARRNAEQFAREYHGACGRLGKDQTRRLLQLLGRSTLV